MRYVVWIVVLWVLSFFLQSCEFQGREGEGVKVGAVFPELKLVTYEQKPFEWRQLKDKVVILKIWATWCGVCREEAPQFLKFSKQLNDSVVVVAVSVDRDLNAAKEYVLDHPDNFVHLFDQSMIQTKLVLKSHGVPQVYVIDRQGVLRFFEIGRVDWNAEMLKKVNAL